MIAQALRSPAALGADRSPTAVDLRDLEVRVPTGTILRHLDLRLDAGSAVALTGTNGSGKTTLLRVLATLRTPSSGRAAVLGADLSDPAARRRVRPRILLVAHEPALHPDLSLAENLRLDAAVHGRGADDIARALAAVGLAAAMHRAARQCSQGMRRRAEFARAWLRTPGLLLVDEAHAALDRDARDVLDATVRAVTAGGGAAVLVSHSPEQLDGLVDTCLTLADGRVVEAVAA